MRNHEFPEFREQLTNLSEFFQGTHAPSDAQAQGYFHVLKAFDLGVFRRACLDLLGDVERQQRMPTPAEIKAAALKYGRPGQQRAYMQCQHLEWSGGIKIQCRSEILVDGEHYYCPPHAGDATSGTPVTREEKIEILEQATPKARAFLRSALPRLMADIPITPEEAREGTRPHHLPPHIEAELRSRPADQADAIRRNLSGGNDPCLVCGEAFWSPHWHCTCKLHWPEDVRICTACGQDADLAIMSPVDVLVLPLEDGAY